MPLPPPPSLDHSCYPPTSVQEARANLWEGRAVPPGLRDRCDIPVESALTPAEFMERYFLRQRPVIIRRNSWPQSWEANTTWRTREALAAANGKQSFLAGHKPPTMGGIVRMDDFLEEMTSAAVLALEVAPRYIWDTLAGGDALLHPGHRHPLEDTTVPAVFVNETSQGPRLAVKSAALTVGPACTGSDFHQHR